MLNFLKFGIVTVYFGICFISCSDVDKRDNITYGYLTATQVEATEIRPAGELSKLQVTYSTNNTCQSFTQFRILKNMNNITNVGVIGSQIYGKQCTDKKEEKKHEFNFRPPQAGEYTWKFWAGRNNDQSSKYVEVTVKVPEKSK
ncbi:hypothetical protein HZP71_15475 [Elizabethkingia anophelis]|nr:hypothetical protein [Elizabethkingia anophelis]